MDQAFLKKYNEILINKQKNIGLHQLAVNHFFRAVQKRGSFERNEVTRIKDTADGIFNTLMDLQNLQLKKMNLKSSGLYVDANLKNTPVKRDRDMVQAQKNEKEKDAESEQPFFTKKKGTNKKPFY